MKKPQEPIAIIGMSCRFPHARDVNEYWQLIEKGELAFQDIGDERWTHSAFYNGTDLRAPDTTYARRGAFVEGLDEFAALTYGLAPRRVEVMDPQQRLAIELTRQAFEDAGYGQKAFDRARTGVFFGASVSEYKDILTVRHRELQLASGDYGARLNPSESESAARGVAAVAPLRAFTISGALLNMISCAVSQTFDFGGPAMQLDAACSSALVAVHEAILNLRAREVNLAVAGGVYLNLGPDNLVGFSRIGALSQANACRPFDASADGFVMGEGIGVFILKRYQDALADGDRVYAIIRGSGCNNDGKSEGPMTPRLEGQKEAMVRAHQGIDCPIETIGFAEAHGTATVVGDQVEVAALKEFFTDKSNELGTPLPRGTCALGSVKANIGHTMSAAGAAGLMKACLVIDRKRLPPQPSVTQVNPALGLEDSPFRLLTQSEPWTPAANAPRRALVSSFGFGGTNVHLVLEEAPEQAAVAEAPELIVLSAPTPALLQSYAAELSRGISDARLASIARTLALRPAHAARVAFVAKSSEELRSRLAEVARGERAPTCEGNGGKLGFLYPGQGAQRVNVFADLLKRSPRFADAVAERCGRRELYDALYPAPSVDPGEAQRRLTRTEVCQPAMVALELALTDLLAELGLRGEVFAGHSLGEFAAAAAAGAIAPSDAVALATKRGEAMAALPLADPGAMLAVRGTEEEVRRYLVEGEGVALANLNQPKQVVLSGTTSGIVAAEKRLTQAGMKTSRLDVSHAFHSPLMQGIDATMKSFVASLPLTPPERRFISCISGAPVHAADELRPLWVRHATSSVRFTDTLQAMAKEGVTDYLHVGPGTAILSFVRALSPETRLHALEAGGGESDGGATFLATVGALWERGYAVNPSAITRGALATLPPIPLITEKYWVVKQGGRRLPASNPTHSPRPASIAAPRAEGTKMDKLIALFQQQTTLMQSQFELLKTYAVADGATREALVESVAATPTTAAPGASPLAVAPQAAAAPVARETASAAPQANPAQAHPPHEARQEVEKKVLASVSRISAFGIGNLKQEQTLVGDLGFDSLMLVELDSDIGKAWPKLGGLPRSLFTKSTTIAQVIDHVSSHMSGAPRPQPVAPQAAAPGRATRFRPTLVPAPRRHISESAPHVQGPLFITSDRRGIAEAVKQLLTARGITTVLGKLEEASSHARVLHLADVDREGPWEAPTLDLLAFAKRVNSEKLEQFVSVTGLGGDFGRKHVSRERLGQVGTTGVVKALAREWNQVAFKSIDLDLTLAPEILAQHVVDEVYGSDQTVEVAFSAEGRRIVELVPEALTAPAVASTLTKDSLILVTGGARGLGAELARGIAARFGGRFVLIGRSPHGPHTDEIISSLRLHGATSSEYCALDLRDTAAVSAKMREITERLGPVNALVHAAGVLRDSAVEQKDEAVSREVLGAKVGGALALLDALASRPPEVVLLVGSWAGRFGNVGQTDYAAANELLARLPSLPSTSRMAVIALPPVEGIGMAKHIPSFRREELAREGTPFFTAAEATTAALSELESGAGETLWGHEAIPRPLRHSSSFPVSRLTHVYLNDHTMAGQRVLPFAAALDHALAASLESSGAPPGVFQPFTVEDFHLRRPVLIADTTWMTVNTEQPSREGGPIAVQLLNGTTVSYEGRIVFGEPKVAASAAAPVLDETPPLALADFYARHTFHGPKLQGIVRIDALGAAGVRGWVRGCKPADWIREPLRQEWAVDPLILDASFQLAGYWAWVKHQRAGFPLSFERFAQWAPFGDAPVQCTLTVTSHDDDLFTGDILWTDASGRPIAAMNGIRAEFKQRALLSSPSRQHRVERPGLPEEVWNPAKFPEYVELKGRMKMLDTLGIVNPYFSVHEAIARDTTVVEGRTLLNFSSYNYVGTSGDPVVSAAAKAAIETYGTSVSASRVASGEKPLTRQLERELADFFGTEDCLVFVSGHATNVTVLGHLAGPQDLIVHDALAHDSIIQGAKLSGAKRRPFPHNDYAALDRLLTEIRSQYRRVYIAIEGVYSMDGDIAPLPRFIELKKKHQAMLLVDEAHSAGVLGERGRGVGEHFGVNRGDVELWMGTLSKAFASCGGYIAGSHALCEYLKFTTPGFIYSVGIPPASAAAALASTRQILAHPERVKKLRANAALLIQYFRERGISTGMSEGSAVVPAILGDSMLCLKISDVLKSRGVNVQPIIYPAVEEGLARLRFFVSSTHNESQLLQAAIILKEELDRLSAEMPNEALG